MRTWGGDVWFKWGWFNGIESFLGWFGGHNGGIVWSMEYLVIVEAK